MQKTFRISVDGRSYTVVVEELGSDGGPLITPSPSLPPLTPSAPPSPVPAPVSMPVAAPAGAKDVLAPLAGTIDSIAVHVGQAVNAGDKVAVIEAMKMKTEVFAKAAGTVKSIAVKIHDGVDTDQVLMSIE